MASLTDEHLREAMNRIPRESALSAEQLAEWLPSEFSFSPPWAIGNRRLSTEPKTVPVPERVAVAEPDGPDAEYLALAEKLRIGNAAILEAKLERILHDECIQIRDYSKVVAYLDNLVEKRNYELSKEVSWRSASWSWFSLRKGEHKGIREERVRKDLYQAAIPPPVLMTIDQIQSRLPEARFFISQIREVQDPFLAVTVPGSEKLWVVERWDEPGFRG